ncbi:putative host cell surface-exposed lipoprotein [Bifidobacterium actinocoloniiforme DSM 22766]|uniref:Putative host cell surface-exposed lipoprotein n=1 Tax=Bifidobacterium actinocoloniiforme DSM 22766 TaxID=1437605 RepID=A0A086Z111_9BIFI|nr:Ltp family lipoprotein [Bifidobacterium actinocoloniiforme]KFI40211.1 putative host cell surface-exposed lipoprotein [Bifidobacterium actinocoloniiforme DSM 22766]
MSIPPSPPTTQVPPAPEIEAATLEKEGKSHLRPSRVWKILLIILALVGFLIAQSDVVNIPSIIASATHSQTPTKSPSPKHTHKPAPTPLPASYREAAIKAQQYADSMHLSEEGIRDQLTSKRDKYSQDEAQYAIEHVQANYPENALFIAKQLQSQGVHDPEVLMKRLTNAHYKFTPADAEYALDQLFPKEIVDSILSEDH